MSPPNERRPAGNGAAIGNGVTAHLTEEYVSPIVAHDAGELRRVLDDILADLVRADLERVGEYSVRQKLKECGYSPADVTALVHRAWHGPDLFESAEAVAG